MRHGAEAGTEKDNGWAGLRSRALLLISIIALCLPPALGAAMLEPATAMAWDRYIQYAHTRMEERLMPGKAFLWVDEAPDILAKVRAGQIVVSPVGSPNPKRVASGLIHDWMGAVYVPNVTLAGVLKVVRDYARYKESYGPTVIDSHAIHTGAAEDRFSLLLLNKSLFLKTALDTEYESCFIQIDHERAYSVSHTTRIQEIEEYGSASEHKLREGEGSGLIWRLFSLTRYEERDGGVYIELEVIGLSRDIPASLRWLVAPIVRRISRGSLSTSLRQTETAVRLQSGVSSASNTSKPGDNVRGAGNY